MRQAAESWVWQEMPRTVVIQSFPRVTLDGIRSNTRVDKRRENSGSNIIRKERENDGDDQDRRNKVRLVCFDQNHHLPPNVKEVSHKTSLRLLFILFEASIVDRRLVP